MLIDKYQLRHEDDAYFHRDTLQKLKTMSMDKSIPHIIFIGNEGSGVKTTVKLFLQMLYGKGIHRLTEETHKVTSSGNSIHDVKILQSHYHIEIQPTKTNFDRLLIQDIVKDYAKTMPLNAFEKSKPFKCVVINNIDTLQYYPQMSLRRTMEKYSDSCRFIMWGRSLSKIIKPLLSRCICIPICRPTMKQLFLWVNYICNKESMSINLNVSQEIITRSDASLKKALWLLQLQKFGLDFQTDYENVINTMVKLILDGNILNLARITELFYELMITNINTQEIIIRLLDAIIRNKQVKPKNKYKIINTVAKYEYRISKGRRQILHLKPMMFSIIKDLC